MVRPSGAMMLITIIACLSLNYSAPAQKPSPGPQKPEKTPAGEKEKTGEVPKSKTPLPSLDQMKLPADAIIIICEQLKEAQKIMPRMVVLTPEKYQQLLDQIKELKTKIRPDKIRPHSCKLVGHLEGEFLVFQADFLVLTQKAEESVFLGCQGSILMEAELDQEVAVLRSEDNGYTVKIPKAGKHLVSLQIKIPVLTRRQDALAGGIYHQLKLGLPAAPITSLQVKLPKTVKELNWNDYLEKNPRLEGNQSDWSIALGKIEELKLSWKEPLPELRTDPAFSGSWRVDVRVLKETVQTNVVLTIRNMYQKQKQWQIWLPEKYEVKHVMDEKGQNFEIARDRRTGIVSITGPATTQVEILATQNQAITGKRIGIGPFYLFGASQQEGLFNIHMPPESLRGQRLKFLPSGSLRQQDLPASGNPEDLVALFKTWDLGQAFPVNSVKQGNKNAKLTPALELEIKPVASLIEASVQHTMRIQELPDGYRIFTISRIEVTPLQTGVDALEIYLPPIPGRRDYFLAQALMMGPNPGGNNLGHALANMALVDHPLLQSPTAPICSVEGTGFTADMQGPSESGKATIYLSKLQTKPFTVILTGMYLIPHLVREVYLPLPKPGALLDKGADLNINAPRNLQIEVFNSANAENELLLHQLPLRWERSPSGIFLGWRPQRIEVPGSILADVHLRGKNLEVRQEFTFDFPTPPAQDKKSVTGAEVRKVLLKYPRGVQNVTLLQGGVILREDRAKEQVLVELMADRPLILEFAIPQTLAQAVARDDKSPKNLEEKDIELPIPLIWPEECKQTIMRVRIWAEPGILPQLAPNNLTSETWKDTGIDIIPGKDAIPALVVQSANARTPLAVLLKKSTLASLAQVFVDRGLVQWTMDEQGGRHCRARFLITKLNNDHLEIQFPEPVSRLQPEIALEQNKAIVQVPWEAVEVGGKVARLALQSRIFGEPAILDIRFQLHGRSNEGNSFTLFRLQEPQILGDLPPGRIRWQILFPSSRIPLLLDDHTPTNQHWRWAGGLFAPESQLTSTDLELWLTGHAPDNSQPARGLVFWDTGTDPIVVLAVPRQLLLLVCSGLFLILGLVLSIFSLRNVWPWIILALLATALIGLGIFRPSWLMIFFYAAQPGIVVLFLVLIVQWVLHRRYRRQLIFLPGFTRLKAGSSLIRSGPPQGREPSTIDVDTGPARVGSGSALSKNSNRGSSQKESET